MHSKKILLLLFTFITLTGTSVAGQCDSLFIVKRTTKDAAFVASELKQRIKAKGVKIFSVISHHEEAKEAGEQLRFTEVITFGNPKVGTKLMQIDQRLGYVLPLKILITQTETGETHLFFIDPKCYKDQYNIKGADDILSKLSEMLNELVNQVM